MSLHVVGGAHRSCGDVVFEASSVLLASSSLAAMPTLLPVIVAECVAPRCVMFSCGVLGWSVGECSVVWAFVCLRCWISLFVVCAIVGVFARCRPFRAMAPRGFVSPVPLVLVVAMALLLECCGELDVSSILLLFGMLAACRVCTSSCGRHGVRGLALSGVLVDLSCYVVGCHVVGDSLHLRC